ncbi:MAG: ABC transporter transmembrane domain-containing protein [Treponema sp.]|nr:ABC transporter transmembrane domain-containing protein [Treponema sp.]
MLKLLRYLRPWFPDIAGVLILVFGATMADLYLPTLMSDIIDKGVMRGDAAYIGRIGAWMLLVTAVSVLGSVVSSWLGSRASAGFGAALRERIFAKVESFSLEEFDRFGPSTLITRSTNDVTQVQMVTLMSLRMMVTAPIMAVGGLVMALSKDRSLTLVFAVTIPVLLIVVLSIFSRALPLFRSIQKKIDRINLVLREGLTGVRVVRAFGREARERERFDEANEDLTSTYIRVNRVMAFMFPSVMLVMNVSSVALLWFGIVRVDRGDMQIGSLMAFIQYSFMILFSFMMFAMMSIMVPRAQAAAVRIGEVLAVEPSIRDPESPKPMGEGARGAVEFRDVTFHYHGAEAAAIEGLSFVAKAGEMTAIVGSTGSGKSTLAKLVPRFYDVDGGHVLVDGVDVRELRQEELRARIGYVPQKPVLFSMTVGDNIRVGIPDDQVAPGDRVAPGDGGAPGDRVARGDGGGAGEPPSRSDAPADGRSVEDLVRSSADIAQATEFIEALENGFDHEVSQGGLNLSGGQKQRLSIARALARRPDIYVFDDCFSALDFRTDARLRARLREVTGEATVIVVAQRVGTVMEADRIIVLDEGRVVGSGTHAELLASCPVYREIAASQLSEERIA